MSPSRKPPKLAFSVVGIGASAGGLAPLQAFLDALPKDTGMAFIVVMHLDPERKSGLPDVLRTHTQMPVTQVTEKVRIEQNHVYVIPPNKELLSTKDSLILADFQESRGKRVPIDQLFRSLASTHESRAYGIILSGSGTDGAIGIKRIKEQGGFAMVQAPEDADFSSMPRAAIATGVVDLILPVKEIAKHIVELAAKERVAHHAPEKLAADDPESLQKILTHLRSRVGHDFSNYKQATLLRRVGRRMQVNRVENLRDYLVILLGNNKEAEALFRDFLIGVTTFFRDMNSWKALAETVVPRIFQEKKAGDSVRAWISGCSSGEEAYSLAILLIEFADKLQLRPPIQIFASDIDDQALERAREGFFPEGIEADVSPERLKRFFTRDGNHYRVRKELRDVVIFATHDLLRDPPFSRLDLVACRNLLIYLDRDTHSRVFEIFHYALRPHGFLFLGSSESLGQADLFRTIDKTHRFYQARERTGQPPHLPTLPLKARQQPPRKAHETKPHVTSEGQLHRSMLEHYAPPSILVDESATVIHMSESAGRYLNPSGGKLSHVLTQLVRTELRLEIRTALHTAFHDNKPTVTNPVFVKFNGSPVPVSIVVRQAPKRQNEERMALVIFLEGTEAEAVNQVSPPGSRDETVAQLETELHRVRQQLQTTVEQSDATCEELKAANEELQSMNEEYRSTTEELETSREELQSVNEELNTVNNELKSKLDEVSQAHNDLQNLMAATDIGTLFLDRQLRIKRYTPRIHQLFNIVPGDLGRPIGHFTHAFDYDDLIPTSKQVLADLRPRGTEVRGKDERWYLMRLRPYRTLEERIEGIVITFVDITERRQAEEALRRSEEGYRILLDNVREYAIFMMDTERRVTTWNAGARRIFGYTADEILGQSADLVLTDEDRAQGVPEREAEIAAREGEAADDRLHRRKDGATFWASGVLAALYDADAKLRGYAKVLRDNTDRKAAEDRLRELNESLENRVKERTQQVRSLASTLTMAEQEERRRISQILHDNLQQLLYSVQMKLAFIRNDSLKADRTSLREKADEACEFIRDAIKTTRQITVDLSPPVLKGDGLTDALQWIVTLMEEAHNLRVTLTASGPFPIPNEDMRVLLFQIVRELLFNVVKHAQTEQAEVSLEEFGDNAIRITVSDNGQGFDMARAEAKRSGFGLFAVRERLHLFGGRMEIASAPGSGCRITLVAPIEVQPNLPQDINDLPPENEPGK